MKFTLITNPVADAAWVSTLLADYKHNGGFIGNDWLEIHDQANDCVVKVEDGFLRWRDFVGDVHIADETDVLFSVDGRLQSMTADVFTALYRQVQP